ncbi:BON domain-containing protein [Nitrosophilus kaiyonis]|uniref:BON domain-containing protein n=1 Tax=Nitrosophilus kaiyonis TaxID=2930200 RepID=UPI002490DEA9|nr:BON domain-containing protein [Nitrosophilus kaiyonis]
MKNRFFIFIITIFLSSNIFASNNEFEDFNKTTQEILKQAYEMFEKSKEIIESLTKTEQKVLPADEKSFLLYHKIVKNSLPVEKRNDFLITAQIKYKVAIEKEISLGNILIVTNNQVVELYGKVPSKEIADKIIDISLKTRGVKEVRSYLIIIEKGIISL